MEKVSEVLVNRTANSLQIDGEDGGAKPTDDNS